MRKLLWFKNLEQVVERLPPKATVEATEKCIDGLKVMVKMPQHEWEPYLLGHHGFKKPTVLASY